MAGFWLRFKSCAFSGIENAGNCNPIHWPHYFRYRTQYHARGIDAFILLEGTKVIQQEKLYDEKTKSSASVQFQPRDVEFSAGRCDQSQLRVFA